jgi:glycine oxidase
VEAAQQRGVVFQFGVEVQRLHGGHRDNRTCDCLHTTVGEVPADGVVIAAGLGSTLLTEAIGQAIEVRPVLGQAIQIQLSQSLGNQSFQPVITGQDIHLVPLADPDLDSTYWVGATVEFGDGDLASAPDAAQLEAVWQGAIALCPALKNATILKTWSGLRPRPQNRPAPIVEPLIGYDNVFVATGHYRNGVLLAPATAQMVRAMLV